MTPCGTPSARFEEQVVFMQQLAVDAREKGDYATAEQFLDRADEAQARAETVREALPRSTPETQTRIG